MAQITERPLTLKLNDAEVAVLAEALQDLRGVKIRALATVNVELGSNPRVRPFTREDFGIHTIEDLITRLEGLE